MTPTQAILCARSRAHAAKRQAQRARSAQARRLRASGMYWKEIADALGLKDAFAASRVAGRNCQHRVNKIVDTTI